MCTVCQGESEAFGASEEAAAGSSVCGSHYTYFGQWNLVISPGFSVTCDLAAVQTRNNLSFPLVSFFQNIFHIDLGRFFQGKVQ